MCLRHGGRKSKATCMREGCHSKVVNSGVCMKHGARRRICSTKGCKNMIVKGGVCVRHGAKQAQRICRWQGCSNVVVRGGVCVRHGANKLQDIAPIVSAEEERGRGMRRNKFKKVSNVEEATKWLLGEESG